MFRFFTSRRLSARPCAAALALCVSSTLGGLLFLPLVPTAAQAQRVTVRRLPSSGDDARTIERLFVNGLPTIQSRWLANDGPVLGLELRTGSLADTLGLDVSGVTTDGPADKAGIASGARLQAINGRSLRISTDDARDPMTADAGYRRLQRVMREVEIGDTVTLQLLVDGEVQTRRVVTTDAASLRSANGMTTLRRAFSTRDEGASLGLSVASADNARDTLGVFITRVAGGGAADEAGVVEGDRIASINGVDVRVPPEDVDDPAAAAARVSRFERALREVEPGETVTLRVYRAGRYREVQATAQEPSASDRRVRLVWPERLEVERDRSVQVRRP